MLGFLILIGLFYSGPEDLVNNAASFTFFKILFSRNASQIGFGLETMMSMMVVVAILNDSLSKIESIPALGKRWNLSRSIDIKFTGLFVLVQIAVTSAAVIAVMLTDKLRRILTEAARDKMWANFLILKESNFASQTDMGAFKTQSL